MAEQAKGGRPSKYHKGLVAQAAALCRFGATDCDLAECFGVDESQINRWKKSHPEFKAALELGKDAADDLVERALFERAIGWSHRAVKIMTVSKGNGEGADVESVPYIERYPPDVMACIYWLNNRRSEKWRQKQEITHELGASLEDLLTKSWQIPPAAPAAAPAESSSE